MRVETLNSPSFSILASHPRKNVYAPNCWNDISEGAYKDYTFEIYQNYEDGKKGPSMIILRKAGLWVLTKIKYTFMGKRVVQWNRLKDLNEQV